jgi:hypothetical protein
MTSHSLWMVRLLVLALSLVVIESALGQSSKQPPDLSSLSDADLKTVTIQLERVGCFGTCPAYSLTIRGDGRVEYNGKGHVKEIGTHDGRIELERIRSVILEFGKVQFWGIAEDRRFLVWNECAVIEGQVRSVHC